MDERLMKQLQEAVGSPPEAALKDSRRQVARWFAQTAPLIRWDVIESPLGPLYIAASARGLCNLDFAVSRADFIGGLDPLAQTEQNPTALAPVAEQLRDYFESTRSEFDLPVDLERLTPFQMSVLQAARRIPPGNTRT